MSESPRTARPFRGLSLIHIYRAVFWANAESRETLLADYVSIAGVLNLPSAQAKEQELAVAEVKSWLESNPGWLLILDNADELALVQGFPVSYTHLDVYKRQR